MSEGNGEVRKLPKGWVWAKHCDIAEINPKLPLEGVKDDLIVSFLPMSAVEEKSGKYDLSQTRECGQVKKGYTPFIDGDIIFAKITPCMENGKVAIVDKLKNRIGFGSTEYHVSRLTKFTVKKFIFHYINQECFRRDARSHMTGSAGQLRVPKSYFEEILIPVAPLTEQKRIVEKIEELFSDLDNGIKNLKTAQKQLKVYRQAVLKWAFEGKLTEEWRKQNSNLPTAKDLLYQIKAERENRYQQQLAEWEQVVKDWEANGKSGKKPIKPQKLKDLPPLTEKGLADLPLLPEYWQWIQLGEVLDDIEAGKSFKCEERPPKLGEVGVAKVSAVTWGEYDELESKTCLEESKINKSLLIYTADFLFSRANTIELVGACTITKKVTLKVMLSDKTLRFRFPREINQKFILYFLRSRYGRNEIERLSTGNQESMRNIGQDRIRNIRTAFPGVLEQEKIVQGIESRLSICDRLEETITTNLKKAEALRQSILKQAFEGKLVPQDPNDEPAEKLLERIKQEKQKLKDAASGILNAEQLTIEGIE